MDGESPDNDFVGESPYMHRESPGLLLQCTVISNSVHKYACLRTCGHDYLMEISLAFTLNQENRVGLNFSAEYLLELTKLLEWQI